MNHLLKNESERSERLAGSSLAVSLKLINFIKIMQNNKMSNIQISLDKDTSTNELFFFIKMGNHSLKVRFNIEIQCCEDASFRISLLKPISHRQSMLSQSSRVQVLPMNQIESSERHFSHCGTRMPTAEDLSFHKLRYSISCTNCIGDDKNTYFESILDSLVKFLDTSGNIVNISLDMFHTNSSGDLLEDLSEDSDRFCNSKHFLIEFDCGKKIRITCQNIHNGYYSHGLSYEIHSGEFYVHKEDSI
jgi:hypothetical protein